MENRRKFYYRLRKKNEHGAWSLDSHVERYNHILNALEAYGKGMDLEDLKFVIKNAFVSKIFISIEAKKKLDPYKMKMGNLADLYEQLIKDGVLDLAKDVNVGKGDSLKPFFDICKLGDRKLGISIEHVVPGDEYINKKDGVISLYNQECFDFSTFQKIFDKICVCLVTSDEAMKLNASLKSNMPPGVNYMNKPFARYDKALDGVGIEVHGPWTMKEGRLEEELT